MVLTVAFNQGCRLVLTRTNSTTEEKVAYIVPPIQKYCTVLNISARQTWSRSHGGRIHHWREAKCNCLPSELHITDQLKTEVRFGANSSKQGASMFDHTSLLFSDTSLTVSHDDNEDNFTWELLSSPVWTWIPLPTLEMWVHNGADRFCTFRVLLQATSHIFLAIWQHTPDPISLYQSPLLKMCNCKRNVSLGISNLLSQGAKVPIANWSRFWSTYVGRNFSSRSRTLDVSTFREIISLPIIKWHCCSYTYGEMFPHEVALGCLDRQTAPMCCYLAHLKSTSHLLSCAWSVSFLN